MALFIMIDFPGGTDNGTRPYTGTTKFWNNSSIWLTGGPSQTSARVGDKITLNVRVSNSGDAPVEDVNVEAFLMNPFVGPFDPAHALVRMRGFAPEITAGSGSTSPTDAHVVDCLVPDPSAGPIRWQPTEAQLETNSGHLCIVANAYADGEGASIGGTTKFQVQEDEHLGQRNIGLLPRNQQMMLVIMPARNGAPTELLVHQLTSKSLRAGERWLLRSRRDISKMKGPYELGIPARGAREAQPLTFSRKQVRGGLKIDDLEIGGNIGAMAGVGRKLLSMPLLEPMSRMSARALARPTSGIDGRLVLGERDTPVWASIDLAREDEPGSLQAFDIVQRDVEGRIIGGYRVLSMQS